MQRISSILPRIIKTFGLESNLQLHRLSDSWVQIVGDTVALHSSPERLRNGILYVAVDSSIWMQQLSFFKKDLVEKVNRKTGKDLISDIRFVIREATKERNPLPVAGDREAEELLSTDHRHLSPKDIAEIEEYVKAINNEEIKESVKKVMIKALRSRKRR